MPDSQDPSNLPEELDDALAEAYGDASDAPSVLDRIQDKVGSRPKVSLRDADGDDPMLKPLGQDDSPEAGKYVIQGELGRGGVGAVHRGHDQDLGRDVAVKFLHERYKDEAQVVHRFVEEAQIGGQLQHPGIVPVYDLGMTDGKPFFTMKLVKGETLSKKLADRDDLNDDRRTLLNAFEDVCQTMAYAHARGVVHRDLKPANIMIGSFGEVQVVDWGMGKVLQHGGVADEIRAARQHDESLVETLRSSGHGSQSIAGSVMGTPAYMPPEQAKGDVEAMDERSDVFALGAILCEILTGLPPYTGDLGQLLSRATNGNQEEAHERLDACGADTDLIELSKRCMAPQQGDRPRTAEDVANAVHAHLAALEARVHEARVEAAEARVKADALRRTQRLSLALVVVFAVGIGLSLFFWKQADDATEAERVAKGQAQDAEQLAKDNEEVALEEKARAIEIKNLIREMLAGITPENALGQDTELLRGILDTTVARLESDETIDAGIAAEIYDLVGRVYNSLTLHEKACVHLQRAVDLRTRLLGENDGLTLESRTQLGSALVGLGRYEEAEAHMRAAATGLRAQRGAEDSSALVALNNLAGFCSGAGLHAEAEATYREGIEIAERVLGAGDLMTITMRGNLAMGLRQSARYAEGWELNEAALETSTAVHGADSPTTLTLRTTRGRFLLELRRLEEALTEVEGIIEARTRVQGPEHQRTLEERIHRATILNNLNRIEEAHHEYRAVIPMLETIAEPTDGMLLQARSGYANTLSGLGEFDEAEVLFTEVLAARRELDGEDSIEGYIIVRQLGALEAKRGSYVAAKAHFTEAFDGLTSSLGPGHLFTVRAEADLAHVHMNLENWEDAIVLNNHALETATEIMGPDADFVLDLQELGAIAHIKAGHFNEAIDLLRVAHLGYLAKYGYEHASTSDTLSALVHLCKEAGRPEDAYELHRAHFEWTLKQANEPNASSQVLYSAAVRLLRADAVEMRDPKRALPYLERAFDRRTDGTISELHTLFLDLAAEQYRSGDVVASIATMELLLEEGDLEPASKRQLRKELDDLREAQGMERVEAAVDGEGGGD